LTLDATAIGGALDADSMLSYLASSDSSASSLGIRIFETAVDSGSFDYWFGDAEFVYDSYARYGGIYPERTWDMAKPWRYRSLCARTAGAGTLFVVVILQPPWLSRISCLDGIELVS
jgi:hypothetical protein